MLYTEHIIQGFCQKCRTLKLMPNSVAAQEYFSQVRLARPWLFLMVKKLNNMCKWTNIMASLQHQCTINVPLIIYSLSPDFCTWTQWDRLMHELQWDLSGGPKKVAQLLVGHNSKTAQINSAKLHTTFFQHVLNQIVNFQSQQTTNVEMIVA